MIENSQMYNLSKSKVQINFKVQIKDQNEKVKEGKVVEGVSGPYYVVELIDKGILFHFLSKIIIATSIRAISFAPFIVNAVVPFYLVDNWKFIFILLGLLDEQNAHLLEAAQIEHTPS